MNDVIKGKFSYTFKITKFEMDDEFRVFIFNVLEPNKLKKIKT